MLSFLKGFKTMLNKQVQLIILLIIGVFVLVQALEGNRDFLPFLNALLPMLLILGAVLLLVNKGQMFAAHVVMFVFLFDDGIRSFFSAITSYNFFAEEFTANFDVYLFLTLIASVYLLMMILSYLLSHEVTLKLEVKPIAFPLFVFSIWCYLCYGFSALLLISLLAVFVLSSGSALASLMIMLSVVIRWPLIVISRFVDDTAEFTDITFWLIALSSVYVIYVLIKEMIVYKDTLKIKEV